MLNNEFRYILNWPRYIFVRKVIKAAADAVNHILSLHDQKTPLVLHDQKGAPKPWASIATDGVPCRSVEILYREQFLGFSFKTKFSFIFSTIFSTQSIQFIFLSLCLRTSNDRPLYLYR